MSSLKIDYITNNNTLKLSKLERINKKKVLN